MFARHSPDVGTGNSACAHTMYMVTYKAMYMPMYIAIRAVVRVRRLGGKNSWNIRYGNVLTAVGRCSVFRSRNLGFEGRNLGFGVRNLGFSRRNLGFQNVTSVAGSMLTRIYVNDRGYEATFLPLMRTRAHVRTRRNVHRAHESSRKLTLRNLVTSDRKEPT